MDISPFAGYEFFMGRIADSNYPPPMAGEVNHERNGGTAILTRSKRIAVTA